jgi:hypothetical protein
MIGWGILAIANSPLEDAENKPTDSEEGVVRTGTIGADYLGGWKWLPIPFPELSLKDFFTHAPFLYNFIREHENWAEELAWETTTPAMTWVESLWDITAHCHLEGSESILAQDEASGFPHLIGPDDRNPGERRDLFAFQAWLH